MTPRGKRKRKAARRACIAQKSLPATKPRVTEAHVELVVAALTEGRRETEALSLLSELTDAQRQEVMRAAVARFAEAGQCDLTTLVGWALEALREIYRRQMEAGALADAQKTVKEAVAIAAKHVVPPDQADTPEPAGQVQQHASPTD